MSTPLYQQMNGQNLNGPIQVLNALQQNPVQFILQRGFNVPANIGSDPNKIIQHLLNTGQVSQDRYNQAVRMMQSIGRMR